jgi:hypothetical protein
MRAVQSGGTGAMQNSGMRRNDAIAHYPSAASSSVPKKDAGGHADKHAPSPPPSSAALRSTYEGGGAYIAGFSSVSFPTPHCLFPDDKKRATADSPHSPRESDSKNLGELHRASGSLEARGELATADLRNALNQAVQAAVQRGEYLLLELLSFKLLSLARRGDRDGIQELARSTSSHFVLSPTDSNLAALSGGSTEKGSSLRGSSESVNGPPVSFSPFITAVTVAPNSYLKCELVPSGVKAAEDTSSAMSSGGARRDATKLLNILEPFLKEASSRARLQEVEPLPILTPSSHVNLTELRDMIVSVSQHASNLTSKEPRLLDISSPCHVLGDLHGNLVDLDFFKRCLWPAGPAAAAGNFLFLGDFVDRGPDSIVVAAYVMAMKILEPSKWFMIRGNHETRQVNGNVEHYGEGSFLWQCTRVFGDVNGMAVWECVNNFFDTLSLAAMIDRSIFCVHGGIPKALCEQGASLADISQVLPNTPTPNP